MDERSSGAARVWATFGLMMLIALVAWSMGSTGLALALVFGAVGSVLMSVAERRVVRRVVPRVTH